MTIEQIKNTDLTVAEIVAETRRIMNETADLFRQARLILEGENEQA